MRLLGIDYGTKRVGLAVSDPLGLTAQPLDVLENNGGLFDRIKDWITEKEVTQIVVGFPRTMKGGVGISAENVGKFIEKLKTFIGIPVVTCDERLTTAEAEKMLISADVKRDRRKQVIDKMAAAYMLQNYMDSTGKK